MEATTFDASSELCRSVPAGVATGVYNDRLGSLMAGRGSMAWGDDRMTAGDCAEPCTREVQPRDAGYGKRSAAWKAPRSMAQSDEKAEVACDADF